jgi:hypothetical protein
MIDSGHCSNGSARIKLSPVGVNRRSCLGRSADTGRICDIDPLRKGAKKLLHLVNHLRLIRAVDVMVCVRNTSDTSGWNSACESFGSCRAVRCIRGKSRCFAFRVVRKKVAPIVRAGKDCEDRNRDGRVLLRAEVERGLDGGARRQRRHRLYVFIALVKNGLEPCNCHFKFA